MRKSWGRTWFVAPALVAGGALALPWETTAGAVYVIDGPTFTGTSTGLDNGFTVLGPSLATVVLFALVCTIGVAFVPAAAVRWVGAVSGVGVILAVFGALTDHGAAVGSVLALAAALT